MNSLDTKNNENNFIQGNQEAYAYLDRLPATPITNDAGILLKYNFGIPDNFISDLRDLASSFRYDKSLERAKRIASYISYFFVNNDGSEVVVIPNAEEYGNTLDGQCGNLTVKFIQQAHLTGWLDGVNSYLHQNNKPIMHLAHIKGYANTHFKSDDTNHVWAGLSSTTILVPEHLVLIDPSFQLISTHLESGYTIKTSKEYRHTMDPKSFERNTAAIVEVGTYDYDNGVHTKKPNVLGLSADRASVLSFGFSRLNANTKSHPLDLVPYVRIANSDDESNSITLVNGENIHDESTDFPESTVAEAKDILQLISKIQIVQNDQAALEAAKQKISITW